MRGVFVSQPSNQRRGNSNLVGFRFDITPRYFLLLMVHLGRPPLPPNIPYCWPLNYLEYVKDFDPNAHVKVFNIAIRANSETNDAKIVIFSVLPFKDIMSNWCNNYLGNYPNCIFIEL